MFENEKKQMATFFNYYEEKFKEKVWVAIECFESEDIMFDLILGEESNQLCGAIISQYIGDSIEEEEEEEEVVSEEENDEEEEIVSEEENDEEEEENLDDWDDEEEGNIIDYNMIRIVDPPSDFHLEGSPFLEGTCHLPLGDGLDLPFILYAIEHTDPEPNELKLEITGLVIMTEKNGGRKIFFQESTELNDLFE